METQFCQKKKDILTIDIAVQDLLWKVLLEGWKADSEFFIESDKESVKLFGLACVVLHNICIELGDLVPRNFDLTMDHASNKRLSPEEVRDVLSLTNSKQKQIEKESLLLSLFEKL